MTEQEEYLASVVQTLQAHIDTIDGDWYLPPKQYRDITVSLQGIQKHMSQWCVGHLFYKFDHQIQQCIYFVENYRSVCSTNSAMPQQRKQISIALKTLLLYLSDIANTQNMEFSK